MTIYVNPKFCFALASSSSSEGYNCDDNNPCTPENAAAGEFYFPHEDPTKFVQCSEWGQCYVMDCGPGTEWNPAVDVSLSTQHLKLHVLRDD